MEEKAILFQAVVPTGERRSLMNAWFKIQPTLKITGPFQGRQLPFRLGISSTLVESSLYTIGGRVPNHFVLSDCISWLDTRDAFNVWETSELQSPCFDSVLGVYRQFLCIFPGVWKHGYYHVPENEYLTTRKGYIWNTKDKENNCNKTGIIEPPPPTGQWQRIRACAALDKRGLLIAMDGEKNNFFLYNPEENNWKTCDFNHPLPKFFGETSFAASNGRLYILELRGMSSAFLYIYNIKERAGKVEGELVINKKPIREFDDYLWLMDKRDRVVRLVPVGDDKLCFLWLGPVSYENENGWPPVRTLHYLKFMVSISPNPAVDFLDSRVFPTNITDLLDCLPCDPKLFGAEEVVMDPATTMAAGENAILFQAVVPSGERKLPINAWFKIQPNDHILGPFHGRQPFRVGISSTFVGSSLYTIGGEVPSSRLPRPCDISWLDTRNPFNGWEIGELPYPCVNSVICFRGYSLYILTPTEGYIWNTKDNQCLETRICPPKVDGGDQKQRLRIRACAALDERGLLIAMDGENSTDFYLHPEPENEARDWERFGTPLPRLTNEISFAASKGRLYILDFPNNPPASLYIYDTKVENLIRNHKMDLPTLNALWNQDEKDRVVRLAPVADDMLCFLWLGPFENKNGWPPVKTLHYLKIKFPFNPNDALFETVESKSFPTKVTKLLDCLPCGPEQFRAEVEGKSPPHHQPNAFQKQVEDASAKVTLTSDAFQKQWEDKASAEALGARFVTKEMMKCCTFRYEKFPEQRLQRFFHGIYYKNAREGNDEEEKKYQCVIMDYEHDHAISQIKSCDKMGNEYALEILHIDNIDPKSKAKVIYPHFEQTVSGWLEELRKNEANKERYGYRKKLEHSEINRWLKAEVIPKIRKLWKSLGRMQEKGIRIGGRTELSGAQTGKTKLKGAQIDNQGYWMPLINGEPMLLNFYEDTGNLDLDYPVTVIRKVLGVEKGESLHFLPLWLSKPLRFWNGNSKPKPSLYYAGKHPALYDSAEKLRFLALFYRCTFHYGLEAWLDKNEAMAWMEFRKLFNESTFRGVYVKVQDHKNSYSYTLGSDVVRYTRNALAHFEDKYKLLHNGEPWDGGEIVEILDEDLAVCSVQFTFAREIIENDQLPIHLTEERWKETQATKWKKLKSGAKTAAEVFNEAYEPAPLEIYTKNNDWDEVWKRVTKRVVDNRQLQFKTDWGWKRGREVFNGANQLPRLWTNEVSREDWRKGWREGWKEAEEIKNEACQTGPPEFDTNMGWKTIKEIIEANQPPKLRIWDDAEGEVWKLVKEIIEAEQPPNLYMGRNGRIIGWVDAFEVYRPRKFLKLENWEKAKKKLEDFWDSLK